MMMKKSLKRFFAVTLAGVLAAGTAISASAAVSYEAPTSGMEANDNYVTASAYAASTVLTQILGLELTSSNGAGIYNSGGSSSSYGTDSSNLGIFGSDINDVPDTYLYNYFYNLYSTQSGGGYYSVDDYAAWTATPYVLRWDSNKNGPQGQASSSTTIEIDGVPKTCNPAFYYEPDIIIGAESGYSTQLASYQETYNSDYNPTIISAVSSSGTRSDGLGLEYNMFEMSANLVEIGEAVAEVEAADTTGKTMTRYEANGGDSAYETAVNYDNFNRGLYYYAQSAFASGELTKINYASSVSYDEDTGWAVTQGTGRAAQYASGIGTDIFDLLADGYTFSDGTVVELTTIESSTSGGMGGGSSTTSAYCLTTDQMKEILTVTGTDGKSYGGVIVGTSQGTDDAYTELASAGISFLNNLPECVYGMTMQTTENGMGIAFYLSYFYYNQNAALNPVSIIGYWIEHFYHVSDTDAMQTVITNMLSSADLNAAYTGSDELNIDEYDEASIEELMEDGIVYYVTVEEPALEAAGTDSSSTAYWSSLDLTVGIGSNLRVTCAIAGHSYDEGVVTGPTCTEDGYTTYTCSVCGDTYTDDYVVATGHNYEDNYCTECDAIERSAIKSSDVSLEYASEVYNGSKLTPEAYVTINGYELEEDTDYTVSYSNNLKVGTATVTVNGTGDYSGTVKKTFKIKKASQSLTVKTSTKTVKYSKVKKKAQTVKAITKVKGAKGTVTYTKSSGSSKFTVNKKTGKITVKKGTKKGTYTIKIKVKSAATSNYKAASKTATVKIKVK